LHSFIALKVKELEALKLKIIVYVKKSEKKTELIKENTKK
jgi:hypothetical protein